MSDTEELRLDPATHQSPTDQRQVLALSGGGYRGLYTALVLAALERKARRPLSDVFDVLAGTSIGGLIAAALAVKIPAADIAAAIEGHGPEIFDRRIRFGRLRLPLTNPARFLYRSRYSRGPLANAIDKIFQGEASTPLSDIATPLMLTAVNAHTGQPSILMSKGLAGAGSSDVSLKDALLATSAAPTYFPPYSTERGCFVDGGLIANAPDLVALTETVRKLGSDLHRTRVLSVGTAGSPHIVSQGGRTPGILSWLIARGLVQLTLSAQEELAVDQCKVLLGDRFLRLDERADGKRNVAIRLDDASAAATLSLGKAAEVTADAMATTHRAAIRRFLSHHAQGPRRPPVG